MNMDDHMRSADDEKAFQFPQEEGKRSEVNSAAKAFRAATAVVVFGIPLVTGAATLLGYGAYKIFKRLTGRS